MLRLLFWPITVLFDLAGLALELTGRAIGFFAGLALAFLGGALCLTIIGAIVGLPLLLLGLGMMVKCLW